MRTGRSRVIARGGEEVFLQGFLPPVRLVITGASHIAQILVRLAAEMEISSIVIDPRTAFATPERFPGCELHAEWPEEALKTLPLDRRTAVAALAHVPDIDDEALLAALRGDCFYIGALGSSKSHAKRVARLKEKGLSDALLARIHAPIGLDIGSSTPNEIALSIIAEIIRELRAPRPG
ncbi:MAG: XdhC family protein [Methyloligellaceae bacterium]